MKFFEPKLGSIDLQESLKYQERINRNGSENDKFHLTGGAYAWVPRKAELRRVIVLPGRKY